VNKLLVERTRFFNICLILVTLMVTPLIAQSESVLTGEDKTIAKMAKTLRDQSSEWDIPVNKHQVAAKMQVEQLFAELKKPMSDMLQSPEKPKPGGRILIFVSWSLKELGVDDIFYTAASYPEALVVFRGVVDEKNFAKSILAVQKLAAKQSPMANVAIDPTLFRKYNVTKVPTIIHLDESQDKEIARVEGLSQPAWLLEKMKAGKLGDFGVRGPVEDILERDLIEVMQDKVAAIDWAQKKEQAIKNYWDKQQFIELPTASKPRRRYLDPTIYISADINDAVGNVIVPQGTRINPLDIRSFNQAVVIFDPLNAKQVRLVDDRLLELTKNHSKVTLIVTQFDRLDGWKSYKNISDHFDAPVFKLTSDVKSRFEVEYLPTVITAKDKYFILEELAFLQDEENEL